MSSAAPVNPGVSNLLQTLAAIQSPVASSPVVAAALEKAPASDIVELSAAAMQVEAVDAMFGLSTPSAGGTGSSPIGSLLDTIG